MEYRTYEATDLTPSVIDAVRATAGRVFADFDGPGYDWKLENMQDVLVVTAADGPTVTGFKIGYRRNLEKFYSWLGGVHPDYRRRGIARRLMSVQHDWCRKRGYLVVETQTTNAYKGMLVLNLQTGFDVVGTRWDRRGALKIVLEKRIKD